MALKEYHLPNGILYVNTGDTIEHIIDEGNPVEILPRKAHLAGNLRGVPLEEYFASPEIWDAKWEIYQAIQKKGRTIVALDARRMDKWGDQIMLTVLPKAYCESWGRKAIVDIVVPKGYEAVWGNNPHIRKVANELDNTIKYDKVIDVSAFGLKFRRRTEDVRCVDAILNGMGLTLINKAPVLMLNEEEKRWAEKKYRKQRPLVGVSLFSAVKSRTYPHMREVIKKLEELDYNIIPLDAKIDDGYAFTFRELIATVNECDLILTADSAILHIAGALKKRVVGLFAYTEGEVFTECYEKADYIQARCPYGKKPCWWKIECLPGDDHLAKTNLDYAHCLKELEPEKVVAKVEEQFTKPRNLFLMMLTYNVLKMTQKAIESIRSWHSYELFIVDNKSTDGTQKWLKEKGINFVSERMSAAAAYNVGLRRFLKGNYNCLMIMNNDVVLRYDTIDKLIECAEKSRASGVMSTLVSHPWKIDSMKPKDELWRDVSEIPAGSYSATLFTRECIERTGFFNERFVPRYIEDNDYTIRMRALGGKFVQAHAALLWHYLGAVVKEVEKGKERSHSKTWDDNINIYIEMYGIHPHGSQNLNRLGLEWKRNVVAEKIGNFIEKKGKAKVRVERRMGGYGDILFTTVIARELKKKFGNKVEINYFIPNEFKSLLKNNPNIDGAYHFAHGWKADFVIDLTDLEWRVEQQEMLKYGTIRSARTEIYLDTLGLDKSNLKSDYSVTDEEKIWTEKQWGDAGNLKRIVMVMRGSNKLKIWPGMEELFEKLMADKKCVINILDHNNRHRYSFRQAAALVATADLAISPDTGISNLAGILDIPVVTIFSNRNKNNFEKMFKTMIGIQGDCPHREENYCDFFCPCFGSGPHRAKENIRVPDCLKRLKVEEVYKKVKEIING